MPDPLTTSFLDQEDAHVAASIRRYGWFIQYVGGGNNADVDKPPFAYTIGLFGLDHPELLIFGTPCATACGVLNELGRRIKSGHNLLPGQLIMFDQWAHRIIPEEVPNPGEIVLGANRYYQRPAEASVPVLQLSYDDIEGHFPWEAEYVAPRMQPRPGTFRA
jgi:hypothetical protein